MRFIVNPQNVPQARPGAYLVRNTVNGKCYVGIGQNVRKRVRNHERCDGTAVLLSRAVHKYGPAAFEVFPLYYSLSGTDRLPVVEAELIRAWNSLEYGYNVQAASGAVGPYGPKFSAIAKAAHASEEVKAKHSAASKAWRQTKAGRAHTAVVVIATQSPESKTKRAESLAAWRSTPEGRAVSSAAAKARYAAVGDRMHDGLKAARSTPEGKARMSEAGKARMASPEMRARVSAATRATMATAEFKAKRSATMKEVHSRTDVKERHRASVKAANADPAVKEKIAASKRGRIWVTDGTHNRCVYPNQGIPNGWWRGKSGPVGRRTRRSSL
jgi:group I intron endonuclease